MWTGIFNWRVIGPFFYQNFNQDVYADLLVNEIVPANRAAQGNEILDADVWFQQDGHPSHGTPFIRNILANFFGNQIIGNGFQVHWPSHSPDFAPNDYFLWSYIKNKLYTTHQI